MITVAESTCWFGRALAFVCVATSCHSESTEGPLGGAGEGSACVRSPIYLLVPDPSNSMGSLIASFDPASGGVAMLGDPACPSPVTNFLGVDHAGEIYTREGGGGEMLTSFRIDPSTLQCVETPFQRPVTWRECMSGSTFSADTESETGESLFFHGETCNSGSGDEQLLALIDPETSSDRTLGSFSTPLQASGSILWPMCGSPDGSLYLSYPASTLGTGTAIGVVDTLTGIVTTKWQASDMPATADQGSLGHEFALWGGDFYLFIQDASGAGTQVFRFRPSDSSLVAVAQFDSPVWAAATSSCTTN